FCIVALDPDTMTTDDGAGNALAPALDKQNQQAAEIIRIQIQSQLARFILHARFESLKRENPRQPSQRGSPNYRYCLGKAAGLADSAFKSVRRLGVLEVLESLLCRCNQRTECIRFVDC